MEKEKLVCVRLDNVQRLIIGAVLIQSDPYGQLTRKWYRLQEKLKRQLQSETSARILVPARLTEPCGVPDLSGGDIVVLCQALAVHGQAGLAALWQGIYAAIEWDYAAELSLYDGEIDLSTIAGRNCLLRNVRRMERLHSLPADGQAGGRSLPVMAVFHSETYSNNYKNDVPH